MKTVTLLTAWLPILLLLASDTIDPLITAEDYKQIDARITKRLRTSKKELWDKMADDIVFWTSSIVNFQWALEVNMTGRLDNAIEIAEGGKPKFIEREVPDKVKKKLNLDEWDLYRFDTLRTDADKQWTNFVTFVNELKLNHTVQH